MDNWKDILKNDENPKEELMDIIRSSDNMSKEEKQKLEKLPLEGFVYALDFWLSDDYTPKDDFYTAINTGLDKIKIDSSKWRGKNLQSWLSEFWEDSMHKYRAIDEERRD